MASRHPALERALVPAQPIADEVRGLQRRTETKFGETIQRLAVVVVGRKRERRPAGAWRVFEQADVVPLHFVEVVEQSLGEGVAAGKSEKPRKALEPGAFGR